MQRRFLSSTQNFLCRFVLKQDRARCVPVMKIRSERAGICMLSIISETKKISTALPCPVNSLDCRLAAIIFIIIEGKYFQCRSRTSTYHWLQPNLQLFMEFLFAWPDTCWTMTARHRCMEPCRPGKKKRAGGRIRRSRYLRSFLGADRYFPCPDRPPDVLRSRAERAQKAAAAPNHSPVTADVSTLR
jgi:hypothetical protein